MTNTKKTGVRALAWVLALAMLVLSIPVMAITAGAEEGNLLSWNASDWTKVDGGGSIETTISDVSDGRQFKFKDNEKICTVFATTPNTTYRFTGNIHNGNAPMKFTFTGTNLGDKAAVTAGNKNEDATLDTTFVANGDQVTLTINPDKWGGTATNLKIVAVSASAHDVTLNQTTGGTIAADKDRAETDDTVTLTATPDFGYVFSEWAVTYGDGEAVDVGDDNTFKMPDSDVTVSATFEPEAGEGDGPFTVTFSGTYGDGKPLTVPGAQTYKKGTKVTLTLDYGEVYKPKDGHDFSLVTAKADNKKIPSKVQIGELINNNADVTVTFTFPVVKNLAIVINSPDSKQPTVTVTDGIVVSDITLTQPVEGGSISAKVDDVDVTKAVDGDTVTLTATPVEGYEFVAWNVTGATVANENPATFTMPKNAVTVSATFRSTEAETYAVTIDENIKNGSIAANTEKEEAGKTVTLTATPNTGYELDSVTVKKTGEEETVDAIIDGNTATFEMPAYAVTVSATFALIDYNVTVIGGTAKIEDATIETAHYQDVVTLVLDENAIPAGKEFVKWVSDVEITDNTFTMPAKDVTVTAKYRVKGNLLKNPEFEGNPSEKTFGWNVPGASSAVCGDGSITFKCGHNGNTGDGLYQQVTGLLPGVKYVFTAKNGDDSKHDAQLFIGSTIDTTKAPIETIAKGDTLGYEFTADSATLEILFYGGDQSYTLSELSLVPKYAPETLNEAKYFAALTLNDNIDIGFEMTCADTEFESGNVKVYVDGVKKDWDTPLTGTLVAVQPDEMAVEHKIMVVYGDVVVKEFDYSVRKYCDAVFAAYKDNTTDPLYQLCEAVLNYGAWVDNYVQELNKVETPESDINAGYEINDFPDINKDKVVTHQLRTEGCITGGGCSLTLGSTITMNFFVTTDEAMPDPEKDILILNNEGNRVDPENITVSEDSGAYTYVISVKNISASKLSRTYKLMFMSDMEAVYVDGESIEQVAEKTESYLQYSVYTYCDDVLDHETDTEYTETLKTLCEAIGNYGEVAKAYEESKK